MVKFVADAECIEQIRICSTFSMSESFMLVTGFNHSPDVCALVSTFTSYVFPVSASLTLIDSTWSPNACENHKAVSALVRKAFNVRCLFLVSEIC